MRIIIIVEEELTHEVFVGFKDDFALNGLGHSLDVLLDEGFDVLVAISALTNLDWVTMVAQMNACTLSGVIAMDVEDIGVTWCITFGRLLTDCAH